MGIPFGLCRTRRHDITLSIDRHLLHEVTSPQAFDGLRLANRSPWRTSANLVVADHNVYQLTNRINGIEDPTSRLQVETLMPIPNNTVSHLIFLGMNDKRQGIVHVIGS